MNKRVKARQSRRLRDLGRKMHAQVEGDHTKWMSLGYTALEHGTEYVRSLLAGRYELPPQK